MQRRRTWPAWRSRFAVFRWGDDIRRCNVKNAVKTNIEIVPEVDGWISELELREASVFCHYTPEQFFELEWRERAASVAHYRLHRLIELHSEDAVNRKVEQEMRKRKKGRR